MHSTFREKQLAAIRLLKSKQELATIVPMRTQYAGDERLCLGVFARVEKSIAKNLEELQGRMMMLEPHHHYYQPQSFHVTIQNVRTISSPPSFSDDDAQIVCNVVSRIAEQHPGFELTVNGIIPLRTSVSAAVLFEESVFELIKFIGNELAACGIADDKSYVDPNVRFANITLCRFTAPPGAELLELLANQQEILFGSYLVDELYVASTNAVYDPLFTREYASCRLHNANEICSEAHFDEF